MPKQPKQPYKSRKNGKTTLETDQILLEYYLVHGNYRNIRESRSTTTTLDNDYPFTNEQSKQRWRTMKTYFHNRTQQSITATSTCHQISVYYSLLKKTILFSITLDGEKKKILHSTREEISTNLSSCLNKTSKLHSKEGVSTFEIHPSSTMIRQYFQNMLTHDQDENQKKINLQEMDPIRAEIGFAHYKSQDPTQNEPTLAAQICSLNGKSYESVKDLFKVHGKLYHKKESCSQCCGFACYNHSILCKGCTYLKLIDHDPVIWIQKTSDTNRIEWTFTLSKCDTLDYATLFNLKFHNYQHDDDEMIDQHDVDNADDEMIEQHDADETGSELQERIQNFYNSCQDYVHTFQEGFNDFQKWKPKFQDYEPPYRVHQLMIQSMKRNRNLLKFLPVVNNHSNFIWIQNGSEKQQYPQWMDLIENKFHLTSLDHFQVTDPVIYVMIFIFKHDQNLEPMIQIGESQNYQKRMNSYEREISNRLVIQAFKRAQLVFCCPLEIQADTSIRRLKETLYICQLLEQDFSPLNSTFSDPNFVNRLHSIFDGKISFPSLQRLN